MVRPLPLRWTSLFLTFLFTGLLGLAPARAQQPWTSDSFFQALKHVAERSMTRVGAMVSQDYPTLPKDVTRLVINKYPRLQDDVLAHLNRKYPKLYSDAVLYVSKQSSRTYQAFQQDVLRNKDRIKKGKTTPADLFWLRVDQDPRLKIEVMTHLDHLYPQLKFDILSRVDRSYPALKRDLFKLMVNKYPGFLLKFTKIWANESFDEIIGL